MNAAWVSARRRPLVVLAACLVAAACAGSQASSGTQESAGPTSTTATTEPSSSTLPGSDAGPIQIDSYTLPSVGAPILFTSSGYPLYTFAPDDRSRVTCTARCASVWPPLTESTATPPKAGSGVSPHLLGTDPDPGGGYVVTYNGWPLYTYTTDVHLGPYSTVAAGQGLMLEGGYWYVMQTDGAQIVHPLPPKT